MCHIMLLAIRKLDNPISGVYIILNTFKYLTPTMTEDDLIRLVQKQKNGKAVGVDGIKAEVMKYMIKKNRIKRHC